MGKLTKVAKSRTFWLITVLFLFVFLNNASFLSGRRGGKPWLLAHGGKDLSAGASLY